MIYIIYVFWPLRALLRPAVLAAPMSRRARGSRCIRPEWVDPVTERSSKREVAGVVATVPISMVGGVQLSLPIDS